MSDVTVQNHGTILTFVLNTEAAKDFAEERVHTESYATFPGGFHCEHRMAENIIEGMTNDGLSVEVG